jgi:hypothetical protein
MPPHFMALVSFSGRILSAAMLSLCRAQSSQSHECCAKEWQGKIRRSISVVEVPDGGRSDDDPRRGFFVAVSDLLAHPWNARVHRSPERIRAIANSMAATRQNHPISVAPAADQPGKYFVVDGETRWKGALQLKWKEIWAVEVEVDPANPVAFYVESFRHTNATKPISAIDQGLRWSQLIAENAASAENPAGPCFQDSLG